MLAVRKSTSHHTLALEGAMNTPAFSIMVPLPYVVICFFIFFLLLGIMEHLRLRASRKEEERPEERRTQFLVEMTALIFQAQDEGQRGKVIRTAFCFLLSVTGEERIRAIACFIPCAMHHEEMLQALGSMEDPESLKQAIRTTRPMIKDASRRGNPLAAELLNFARGGRKLDQLGR